MVAPPDKDVPTAPDVLTDDTVDTDDAVDAVDMDESGPTDRTGPTDESGPTDDDVLKARGLSVTHHGSAALTEVSLAVAVGEIVAVTGPRGSGKTTLLRCLSGQLAPTQGEVWFHNAPLYGLRAQVRERVRRDWFGWIGSRPDLVPELTAWENAALPLLLAGAPHRTAKARALEWLGHLDTAPCATRRPHTLTQTERQRVAIARSLVAEPSVLFADEPTAPLHQAEHSHVLRTVLTVARARGMTVVLATADQATATAADRTVALLDGRLCGPLPAPGTDSGTDSEGQTACSLSA